MLTGRQIEQLQDALLDAFASHNALRMLARIELEQNLDAIAGGENLRVLVFNLISWAEQTGTVAQLIDGACRQNAGNARLRDVQRAVQGWGIAADPTTASHAKPVAPRATVDIFLSYSRLDRAAMHAVYAALRGAGFSVWIDEGLEPGTPSWIEAIEEALEQAQAMVALLSPHAKASTWVRREISYAQAQHRHVFPLLIDGEQATSVPLNLSEVHWIDGRRDVQRATQRDLLPVVQRHFGRAETKPPIAFDWVEIPAGKFVMGSDKTKDPQAYDDELPQQTVTMPAYRMARTPVTNAQYQVFVQATGHRAPQHWKNGRIAEGKEEHPVVYVSWQDAVTFCRWASEVTGTTIRLPSEAEWEKGVRGADGRLYPWGNAKPTPELCNFNMNVGDTTPVGSYPKGASPYGVLDAAGNVWEWTNSLFKGYPYDPADGREDSYSEGNRAVRGGSFGNDDKRVRCACRNLDFNPNSRVGLRVVSPGSEDSGL
jgi:formylglycine-generating enzyme required for sulfatase activity